MRDFLRPTGAVSTSGAFYSPFFAYLTDDGTDRSLNEDYSAGAVDAYWQCPTGANAIISNISIALGDGDFAQAIAIATGFVSLSSLSNGLKFAIKNSGGTVIQDLTVSYPLTQTGDVLAFCTSSTAIFSNASATTADNELLISANCHVPTKFGGYLFVPKGGRFVCTLQDNLSGLDLFSISISGHYV